MASTAEALPRRSIDKAVDFHIDGDRSVPLLANESETPPHSRRQSLQEAPPAAQTTSVLTRLVSLLGLQRSNTTPELYTCHICFEELPVNDSLTLTACGHHYCYGCFKSYLELKINEGTTHPVCFHPVDDTQPTTQPRGSNARNSLLRNTSTHEHKTTDINNNHDKDKDTDKPNNDITTQTINVLKPACGAIVDDAQLERIVDDIVWQRLQAFQFNKTHARGRECPFCHHAQDCVGPDDPAVKCEQCGEIFCFFHSNAHVGSTCAEYELKIAESEALNHATIETISRPCPGCKSHVEKHGGCNHMKCTVCEVNFCWLCGEIIASSAYDHFDPDGGTPCSGRQNEGNDGSSDCWILHAAFACMKVVCYPIALVLAAVLWILSFGKCDWHRLFRAIHHTLSFLAATPLVIELVASQVAIGLVFLTFFGVYLVIELIFKGLWAILKWLGQRLCGCKRPEPEPD